MTFRDIEQRVQKFVRNKRLFDDGAGILVALSGGADSMALLHILVRLGYRCHAVHCNFHLRDYESDRDEKFSLEQCHSLNIPCEVVHFDTQKYATEHHISIEMAARELRYREFERIRQSLELDVIAVAHHQDDEVETLLLNLIRGSGINGLIGMRAINGHVVRPLLCITRNDIISYLKCIGQTYITDSTNLTDVYARNKIRLNILPLMQQINPAAKENILQTATHLAEVATIYNKVIVEEHTHIVEKCSEGINISISALQTATAPQASLFEILRSYGFNSAQVTEIFRSLNSEPGRLFYSMSHSVLRDRTHLLVRRKLVAHNDETEYILPHQGILTLPDGSTLIVSRMTPKKGWQIPRQSEKVFLDSAQLSQPLTVRHPRIGDRFHPFGMKGTKLLSDFYTDIKVPRTEKSLEWIVCHGNDIVWVIGRRSSEQYRLRGGEREIVMVEIVKSQE